MKSRIKYDAVATVDTYKDKQTGEDRKQYLKVGTVFESEDGRLSLKLDAIPCGPNWSGYINLYEPKPRDGQRPQDRLPEGRRNSPGMPPAPQVDTPEDDGLDIPF